MAINISDVEPRVQYTATAGQTSFTVNFEFFANADLKVFNGDTQLSFNASPSNATQYSVTGAGVTGGGSITLGSPGATVNDVITISRDIAIQRTTDFPTSGAFQIASLNEELDKIVAMCQQLERDLKFSPRASETTANTFNITFPNLVANKVLNVNSAGNGLEFTVDKTDVATIAGIAADVTSVAGIASNVTSVASNISNINSVNSNASNINAVAGNETNINAVNSNATNITAVAGAIANVNTVATNIANVNLVAADIAKVIAVANDLAETVSEIETVADDLNETTSEIDTVAGSVANVNAVGTAITNVNLVAGSITNVNSVAGSIAAVNNVSSNLTGINAFNERYRVGASDPTTSLDSGDLNFNTSSSELKYYDGANWQTVASQDQNVKVSANDTSASVLNSKIAVAGGLTKTITNPGSNETLTLTAQAAEVYGFELVDTDSDGIAETLRLHTTNGGADNINSTTYAGFDDVIYGASGMTWSLTAAGELRVTI